MGEENNSKPHASPAALNSSDLELFSRHSLSALIKVTKDTDRGKGER